MENICYVTFYQGIIVHLEDNFLTKSIDILYGGDRITEDTQIWPTTKHLAINIWLTYTQGPKNVTELKSFLSLINYYQRHSQNSSSLLEQLHCLLRKETLWKWTEKENNSFKKEKLLSSKNLLVH